MIQSGTCKAVRVIAPKNENFDEEEGLGEEESSVVIESVPFYTVAFFGILYALGLALLIEKATRSSEYFAFIPFFVGLAVIAIVDLRTTKIRNILVYPTLAATVISLVITSGITGHWPYLLTAAGGGVILFAIYGVVWYAYPKGMGFGDVRMAGLIGVGVGWISLWSVAIVVFVASIAGLIVAIVAIAATGKGSRLRVPFGPALAIGGMVGVLWGPHFVNLWLHR